MDEAVSLKNSISNKETEVVESVDSVKQKSHAENLKLLGETMGGLLPVKPAIFAQLPKRSIVNENLVEQDIGKLELKIAALPLSDKFKGQITDRLKAQSDDWKKKFDDFKVKFHKNSEADFKQLFQDTLLKIANFEEQPSVKRILTDILPFFENKDGIQQIIDLEEFGRGSKDWRKIDARLATLGITYHRIRRIQQYLGVQIDGLVGPQTITALNKQLYDKDVTIKYAKATKHRTESAEEFDRKAKEAAELLKNPEWKALDAKLDADLARIESKRKDAKTVDDIEQLEKEEEEVLKKDKEERGKFLGKQLDQKKTEKKEAEETLAPVSDGFKTITENLGISEERTKEYWAAYMEVQDGERIPTGEIKSKLETLEARLKIVGMTPELSKRAKIEAFGKMINGQRSNLFSQEVMESVSTQIDELSGRLEGINAEIDTLKEEQKYLWDQAQELFQETGDLTGDNSSWYEFWDPGNEDSIAANLKLLQLYTNVRSPMESLMEQMGVPVPDSDLLHGTERLERQIEKKKSGIQELKKRAAELQYVTKKDQDKPVVKLCLDTFRELGADNIPDSMSHDMAQSLLLFEDSEELSPLEKLFYSGKFEEALKLAAQQDVDQQDFGLYGKHDLLAYFQQKNETEYWANICNRNPNSFEAKKIAQGYIPFNIGMSQPSKDFLEMTKEEQSDFQKNSNQELYLGKVMPDGTAHFILVGSYTYTRGFESSFGNRETSISPSEIGQIAGDEVSKRAVIEKTLSDDPALKALAKSGELLGTEVIGLQKLLSGAAEGVKSEEYVAYAKQMAGRLKNSSALAKTRYNLQEAKAHLQLLKEAVGTNGSLKDDFESDIAKLEEALSTVAAAVEGGKIEQMCDYVLSDKFYEDDFLNWVRDTAIPFFTSIAVAVVAIVTFVPSGGTSSGLLATGATLFKSAMIISAGGIVGQEVGMAASNMLGNPHKTMLAMKLSGEKILDLDTGKMREITFGDLAENYGSQFGMGTLTTFAMLGLGSALGRSLSGFAQANQMNAGAMGKLARFLTNKHVSKIFRLDSTINAAEASVMKKVASEVLEEIGQESFENAAQKISPILGFAATLRNCMHGRVQHKFGKYDVVAESSFVEANGSNVTTNFSFDARQSKALFSEIHKTYGSGADFKITGLADGGVSVELVHTRKDGTKFKNTMIFNPTNESVSMRKLFTNRPKGGAESYIEMTWGGKKAGENQYTFNELQPDGKISLAKHLKRQGFVISGDPESGTFKATKGNDIVEFKQAEPAAVEESSDGPVENPATADRMAISYESSDTGAAALEHRGASANANTEAEAEVEEAVAEEAEADLDEGLSSFEEVVGLETELFEELAKESPNTDRIQSLQEQISEKQKKVRKSIEADFKGLEEELVALNKEKSQIEEDMANPLRKRVEDVHKSIDELIEKNPDAFILKTVAGGGAPGNAVMGEWMLKSDAPVAIKTKYASLNKSLNDLRSEFNNVRATISAKEAQISAVQGKMNTFTSQIDTLSQSAEQKITNNIEKLNREISRVKGWKEGGMHSDAKRSRLSELNVELKVAEAQLAALKAVNPNVDVDLDINDVESMNEEMDKIKDTDLRAKVKAVYKGLMSGRAYVVDMAKKTWESIKPLLSKSSARLKAVFDARFKSKLDESDHSSSNDNVESEAKDAESEGTEAESSKVDAGAESAGPREKNFQEKHQEIMEEVAIGKEVFTRRSNGQIERGWVVFEHLENGSLNLYKTGMSKVVSFDEVWTIDSLTKKTEAPKEFSVNEEVYVMRSNGAIEGGWRVRARDDGSGKYDVVDGRGQFKPNLDSSYIFSKSEIENGSVADMFIDIEGDAGKREQAKAEKAEREAERARRRENRESKQEQKQAETPPGGSRVDREELLHSSGVKSKEEIFSMNIDSLTDVANSVTSSYSVENVNFALKLFSLNNDFSTADLKKAYRKLFMEFHPDRNSEHSEHATIMSQIINNCNDVLKRDLEIREPNKDSQDYQQAA